VNVTPLATHSSRAVRDALTSHGWDEPRAESAAGGLGPFAVLAEGLSDNLLPLLLRHGNSLGLEIITGEDWSIVVGSRARLGALARPWGGPEELAELAHQIGLALPPDEPENWLTARGPLTLDRYVILGVLNVTPDSFSDGGRFNRLEDALAQGDRLLAEGARILDVGGESTRPGRPEPVSAEEERSRVVPVIEALVKRHPDVLVSVDTVKAEVARVALEAGAAIVNDVSAFRLDPGVASAAAQAGAGVILMHSRGSTGTMATLDHAEYDGDLVGAVRRELAEALNHAVRSGIAPEAIALDPGFGFAKTAEHNLLLADRLADLVALGRPVLVGPSRKRFLGSVTGREVAERDVATAAACVMAYERGARLFRVHNVAVTRDALAVAHAVRGGR
jgi:dihydropteroate synthase